MMYPNEPACYWLEDDFAQFLLWAVEQDASDINLVPGEPVWVRIHGGWQTVTHRDVTADEIFQLADSISKTPSTSGELKGGVDKDFAFEVTVDRFKVERFRVNASACRDGRSLGATMVMRSIPSLPPKLDELNVETEILKHGFPSNGLVLVTGVMGTGKSTLLASMLRNIRENHRKHIATYEHPIEFDLMGIPDGSGPIVQMSIPEHISGFHLAPKNAARRAVDVALVGESRDQETMRGMLENAEMGMAVYSTVHTRSVSATPMRIVNVFPHAMRDQIFSTLMTSLRLIVQQRLVPCPKGGRVALREYLVFDRAIREELLKTSIVELDSKIQKLVEQKGKTLLMDVKDKYNQGLIHAETVKEIEVEFQNVI